MVAFLSAMPADVSLVSNSFCGYLLGLQWPLQWETVINILSVSICVIVCDRYYKYFLIIAGWWWEVG